MKDKLHPETSEKLSPEIRIDRNHSFLFKKIGDHVGDYGSKGEDIISRLSSGEPVLCSSMATDFCPKCEANEKDKVVCQLKKVGLV